MKTNLTKFQFYFLSFTWGLPTTLAGCLAALILLAAGKRPKKWGYCYYFEIGKNWGGMSLGIFFIKGTAESIHIKNHEHGHSIQNCHFGPLMPILVNCPSSLRFWWRKLFKKHRTPYDSIWFEGQATRLGTEFINWYTKTEVD